MTDQEYNIGYLLHLENEIEELKRIITKCTNTDDAETQDYLLELIAIYYMKPFMRSNAAYPREKTNRLRTPHKIDLNALGYSTSQKNLHELIKTWRNNELCHLGQDHRIQDVSITTEGYKSIAHSTTPPLVIGQLKLLKSNLTVIEHHISKLIEAEQNATLKKMINNK